MRLKLFAAAAVLLTCLSAHADSITGSTVDVRYLFPDTATVSYDSGVQTVADGMMLFDDTDGVSVTFHPSAITITNLLGGLFSPTAFNGLDFSFLSGRTITGVTFDPSSSTLFKTGAVLSFTGNDIRLNLAGTCALCTGQETIQLNVTTSNTPIGVTPEPSSFMLLGTGLLGVAGAAKRRFA